MSDVELSLFLNEVVVVLVFVFCVFRVNFFDVCVKVFWLRV